MVARGVLIGLLGVCFSDSFLNFMFFSPFFSTKAMMQLKMFTFSEERAGLG